MASNRASRALPYPFREVVKIVFEVAIREKHLKTNSKDDNYIDLKQFVLSILFFFVFSSLLANSYIALIIKALLLTNFEFNCYSLCVALNMLFKKFRVTQLYFVSLNNSLQILNFNFEFLRARLI